MTTKTVPSTVSIKNSIGLKLLTMVFSIYFLVTLTLTIAHMVVEYRNAKDEIAQELQDLGDVFEPGFAVSLWNEDDEQAQSLVEGLIKIPIVIGIKLESIDDELLYATGNVVTNEKKTALYSSEGKLRDKVEYKTVDSMFSYRLTADYEGRQAGTITLYSSNNVVLQKVQYGFLIIIVNALLKTFALWIIFLWVSRRILSRPLSILTNAVSGLDLEKIEKAKQISTQTSGRNELKILEEAFNAMTQKLKHTKNELDSRIDELKDTTFNLEHTKHRLEVLLNAVTHMAGSYDQFNLMVNVTNTILHETFMLTPVDVHFAFPTEIDNDAMGFAHFQLEMKAITDGRSWIEAGTFGKISDKKLNHYFSESIPPFIKKTQKDPKLTKNRLTIPLWEGDLLQGFIIIRGYESDLKQEDYEFISMLAHSLAISVKMITFNFQLLRAKENLERMNTHLEDLVKERTIQLEETNEQLAEKNSEMEEDLKTAAEVQKQILTVFPPPPFLEIATRYLPHSHVSGDIYHMYQISKEVFTIFLGDGTGHGVAAALTTIMADVVLDDNLKTNTPIIETLMRLNDVFEEQLPINRFMTGILLSLDENGKLKNINGGHPPMIVIPAKDSTPVLLKPAGTLLGVLPSEFINLEEGTYTLCSGDRGFIYTDGITERVNPAGQMFGIERLGNFLASHHQLPLDEVLAQLLAHLNDYAEGQAPDDDITIVGFEFKGAIFSNY